MKKAAKTKPEMGQGTVPCPATKKQYNTINKAVRTAVVHKYYCKWWLFNQMKRKICSIYVITICLILIACSRTGNEAIDSSSTTSNSEQKPSAYDIIERENSFIITVYDEDRLPFEELGPFSKEPEVVWINEEIIRVSVQAGTGKETKWGIFYDLAEHRQSNTFYGILAETADIVVYCGDGCIIIQNIFDAEKFYQEINSFPKELAPAAAPFVSASISNDGKTVEIDYLSGSDFHTETVRVPLS